MKSSKVLFATLLLACAGFTQSRASIDYSLSGGAGIYNALIGSGTSGYDNSGSITLDISPSGVLSGKLLVANRTYPLHSSFQWNMAQFRLGETSAPLILSLSLNPAIPAITGSLSASTWGAGFTALRTPYSSSHPAPQAGRYTLLLSPTQPGAAGQGYGYATMLVNSSGKVAIAGRSEIGSPFTTSAYIDGNGMFPLYAVSTGSTPLAVHGWVQFQSVTGVSDCAGIPGWSASTSGTSTPVALVGSRYNPSASAGAIFPSATGTGNSTLGFGQGSLSLTTVLVALSARRLTPLSTQVTRLKFNGQTGVYSGSLNLSGSGGSFFGVAYQSQSFGAGILLTKNSPGWVYLSPPAASGSDAAEGSAALSLAANGSGNLVLIGMPTAGSANSTLTTGLITGTGAGTLSGSPGSGTIVLAGGNTYAGGTLINNGGIIMVNSPAPVGSGTDTLTLGGTGTLTFSGTLTLNTDPGGAIFLSDTATNFVLNGGTIVTTPGAGLPGGITGITTLGGGPGLILSGSTTLTITAGSPIVLTGGSIVLPDGETIQSSGSIDISGGVLNLSGTDSQSDVPVATGTTEDISTVSPLTVTAPILVTSGTLCFPGAFPGAVLTPILISGTNVVLTSGTQ